MKCIKIIIKTQQNAKERERKRRRERENLQQINNNNNNKKRKSCCINASEAKTHKCNKYGSALQFIKSKTKGAIGLHSLPAFVLPVQQQKTKRETARVGEGDGQMANKQGKHFI